MSEVCVKRMRRVLKLRVLTILLLAILFGGSAALSIAMMGTMLASVIAFFVGLTVTSIIYARRKRRQKSTHK